MLPYPLCFRSILLLLVLLKLSHPQIPSFVSPLFHSVFCAGDNYARVAFDIIVAVVCVLSLVLCGRSILRGVLLQHVRLRATQIVGQFNRGWDAYTVCHLTNFSLVTVCKSW